MDDAEVYGSAEVHDHASILQHARVYGRSDVYGHARVSGEAVVKDTAQIYDFADIYGDATILENARVYDQAHVDFGSVVYGDAKIHGNVYIFGGARIRGDASIEDMSDFVVFKNTWSSGRYFTWTRSNDMWTVGCFYGTGKELIKKAYLDDNKKGQYYEAYVKLVEKLKAIEEGVER